jgi:hypothetical protein
MIPRTATLDNSVLLVIDAINSCAHRAYEDPERGIHYHKQRMWPLMYGTTVESCQILAFFS